MQIFHDLSYIALCVACFLGGLAVASVISWKQRSDNAEAAAERERRRADRAVDNLVSRNGSRPISEEAILEDLGRREDERQRQEELREFYGGADDELIGETPAVDEE